MEVYNSTAVLILQLISTVGTIFNFICSCYILKYFNVKETMTLLLLIDSVVGCLGSGSTMVCCCHIMPGDYFSCVFLTTSLFLPVTTGNVINMETSAMRLYSMKLSAEDRTMEESSIQRKALIFLLLSTTYFIAFTMFFSLRNIPFHLSVEICLHGNQAVLPYQPIIIGYHLPFIVLPAVISFIMDCHLLWTANSKHFPAVTKHLTNPPLTSIESSSSRAKVLITVIVTPLIVAGIIQLRSSGPFKVDAASGAMMLLAVYTTCRCPIATVICSVAQRKQANLDNLLKEETRKMRLRKVLHEAREEMDLRKTELSNRVQELSFRQPF